MVRQRISSGAAFEDRFGYSRAVRVGRQVWVAGTAPIMPGNADPPDDPYEQARICFQIIAAALTEAGAATLGDVVRSRMFLTSARRHRRGGRARTRRRSVQARAGLDGGRADGLLDPRWRIEIEVEAVIEEPR